MTPDEIRDLFKNTPDDEESRIKALKNVLTVAQGLREAKSPELVALAEKVGIGSREELWRIPLGRSGLLDFFLSLTKDDELDQGLIAYALRIVGNSCADQDENRQRVVDSGCLPQLVKLLGHDSLLQLAIPVLFNICVDYEPAQAAASKSRLSYYLVELITDPGLREKASVYINIVYKLFDIAATQEFEPDLLDPQAPYLLLARAGLDGSHPDSLDLEGFLSLSSAALAFLSHSKLQEAFLETPDAINVFLAAFQRAIEAPRLFEVEDAEERAQLNQLQNIYTQTLADISAHPRFVTLCSLDGPLTALLLKWLSSHHTPLQTASCLALGNIARSDAPSISLVQEMSIHRSLISIISSADSPTIDLQLLHSALSFLKNLSIPTSNKAVMGDAGILDPNVLPRLWEMDTQPQIQFDAVSLARLLLVNCPANVRRICSPFLSVADPSLSSPNRTPLHQLMNLHRKADQEPIKMETARAVANICRVLHSEKPPGSSLLPESSTSPSSEDKVQFLLQDFYSKQPALADILLYLGLQKKFPILRSELWFVLALMARSAEGAAVVSRFLRQRPEIVSVLVEAVTGEKMLENQETQDTVSNSPGGSGLDLTAINSGLGQLEPQQVDPTKAAAMTKVDRENGLVLITELLNLCSDELPPGVRNTFSRISKTGGELLLGNRGEEASKGKIESAASR
ncbi:ARM repeat-containing protein [Hypoxylon sp. FL1857]|nr:ARM repeat-containing protein [Hypoxylon sp. FL1857]